MTTIHTFWILLFVCVGVAFMVTACVSELMEETTPKEVFCQRVRGNVPGGVFKCRWVK